jgi:DNA-binding HxlR family transcriptional regulator
MKIAPATSTVVDKAPPRAAARPKVNPWDASCPSRAVIDLLASKWVLLLVPLLRRAPKRNGDLMRGIPGVSQKMLTQTLRELERSGLVTRNDFGEVPPRVEYALTPLGKSLAKAIATFDDWVIHHYYDMVKT